MKKVLTLIVISLLGVLGTASFLLFSRYQQNPEQIVPYPYEFDRPAPGIALDAPILITGDRMGVYFGKFKEELAATISANLAKPIKVQSMAKEGFGLHRTIHQLRSLVQWPQILIYQGGSEEFLEKKFHLSEVSLIKTNFSRYNDERIETFMILYPGLSRLVYEPINRLKLAEEPAESAEISEEEYFKRLETELLLYEQQLLELIALSKDRNSLLILSTTPINLDILPKKVCEFTRSLEIDREILELKELLKRQDPKAAYGRSSRLVKQHLGNASLYYIHGQIARRLGFLDEAVSSFLEASSFDCEPWRVTEIHNSIIRRVAREQQVILFDFAKLLEKEYTKNTTFYDELYPQNLYYELGMQQLGLVIKSILKL